MGPFHPAALRRDDPQNVGKQSNSKYVTNPFFKKNVKNKTYFIEREFPKKCRQMHN